MVQVQVTNFLLRWLFLCRLVDDRAEVQTWPYRRPGYYEHPPQQHQQHQSQPQQQYAGQHQNNAPPQHQDAPHPNQRHQSSPKNTNVLENDDDRMDIPTYRESVIRTLTSYPPGSSDRLQKLEELRLLVVHDFASRLVKADEVIRWGAVMKGQHITDDADKDGTLQEEGSIIRDYDGGGGGRDDMFDSRLDADTSIQDEFQQFMQQEHSYQPHQHYGEKPNLWQRLHLFGHHEDVTDGEEDSILSSPSTLSKNNPLEGLTPEQVEQSLVSAHKLLSETRSFLPQLVSTVLHSPPALIDTTNNPNNSPSSSLSSDPISSLRSLLIHRCQTSPSLGIELCWLLEAEVGRKWKALFEHRQQTGKRLILIVQADIAAAIATIGAEKASAFNLLQDAEMATAFGVERDLNQEQYQHPMDHHHQYPHPSSSATAAGMESHAKPPQSISDLRCRHFGDSMHFVDRLTQISLDLRHVPPIHRQSHLQLRLAELNRRLCRRMISRGQVSIDVEDNMMDQHPHYNNGHQQYQQQQNQWREENVREDMIQHSVHFPMDPACVTWPGGMPSSAKSSSAASQEGGGTTIIPDFEHPEKHNGVVRALRILPSNCRVLDSAQRCPFLVRMEVAETGLDANDARLYAMDVPNGGVGLTIEEAMGINQKTFGGGFDPCEIPPELMGGNNNNNQRSKVYDGESGGGSSTMHNSVGKAVLSSSHHDDTGRNNDPHKAVLSRGGDQGYGGGEPGYYPPPDSFDMLREQHFEELHQDLRQQRENDYYNAPNPSSMVPHTQHSMGSALLDKVFGRPWHVECETIRQQSPYRHVKGWKLASFIIKAGEDIRKEALVMQIMSKLWTWFQDEIPPHLRPFLRPYTIMCVGGDAGIVECLPDVKSVNELKKETDGFTSLRQFFERAYGPPVKPPYRPDYNQQSSSMPNSDGAVSFEKARDNFLRSLVGYSVICYILQIKDRHNANILMDREGHIMHIDFGFVLGETPKMGKVPLFSERAPFKLSAEYWEVIGGWSAFKRFCEMFEAAYAVAASHSDEICSLVEAAIMNVSRDANLARSIADSVRGRIQMKADPKEQKMHIMNIVNDAITSWGTSTYDWLQRSMHGYQ